jgi:hypothetical protein
MTAGVGECVGATAGDFPIFPWIGFALLGYQLGAVRLRGGDVSPECIEPSTRNFASQTAISRSGSSAIGTCTLHRFTSAVLPVCSLLMNCSSRAKQSTDRVGRVCGQQVIAVPSIVVGTMLWMVNPFNWLQREYSDDPLDKWTEMFWPAGPAYLLMAVGGTRWRRSSVVVSSQWLIRAIDRAQRCF